MKHAVMRRNLLYLVLSKGKRKMHSSIPSDIDSTLLDSDEDDSDLDVRKMYNTKLYDS